MNPGTEHRKLAAIMFTDMAGYTALAQRNEMLALELLEEHRRILRALFPRFNGTEIKTIGDAFLVEFGSALAAARCAIEIQRALAKRNHDVTPDRRIELKIGIHIGDVVHRGGDVYGDGVNIASRIEQVAGPSGICISMDVERQIRHALEASLVKLPPAELKNLAAPMDLFRIVLPWERAPDEIRSPKSEVRKEQTVLPAVALGSRWAVALAVLAAVLAVGLGWWVRQHRGASPSGKASGRITALAVKPLDDFSGDTNNAYLSDGMTEALCSALGHISALRVPGRASVMRYKGGQKSIREMAKELSVDAIVEGSVQRTTTNMLVTAQLIEAATDRHLWSTNYKRDLSDFFVVQSEVARAIAAEIQVRLTPEDQARLAQARRVDPRVVEACLLGFHHWSKFTETGLTNAFRYFREAIAIDSHYAPAHSGLSACYGVATGWLLAPSESVPLAKAEAQKAIDLDPASGEGYSSRGMLRLFNDWDWRAAESDLRRAIELNPNRAAYHDAYVVFLLAVGRTTEAVAEQRKSLALDPLSLVANNGLASALYLARRFDDAVAQARRTLELDANNATAHMTLASSSVFLSGRAEEAQAHAHQARQLDPLNPSALVTVGYVLGVTGQRAEALKVLQELERMSQQRPVSKTLPAIIHLGLGNKAEALRRLERAVADKDVALVWLKAEPVFDSLRAEPAFQALLKRLNYPP
jgi:class 3 adenylate cyclase/TolB-like protein/Flp pilus assembly protein TadD